MIPYTPRILPDGRAMLNVGCGNRYHPQMTNIDHIAVSSAVIAHDITAGLPFADNTFDVVYHSHVLEHLQQETAHNLLRDCYRVLKSQGVLRVLVPDLEFSVMLYLKALNIAIQNPSPINHEHYEWAILNLIDQMVRVRSGGKMADFIYRESLQDIDFIVENGGGNTIWEMRYQSRPSESREKSLPIHKKVLDWIRHRFSTPAIDKEGYIRFRQSGELHQWMYDRYSLLHLLTDCGFRDLRQLNAQESQIANWEKFHLDVDPDGSIHKPYSLVCEGRK
jgi:predicted SAM-dependent methyltransferase